MLSSLDIGCPGQAHCAISMYACGVHEIVQVVSLMSTHGVQITARISMPADVPATTCFHL